MFIIFCLPLRSYVILLPLYQSSGTLGGGGLNFSMLPNKCYCATSSETFDSFEVYYLDHFVSFRVGWQNH